MNPPVASPTPAAPLVEDTAVVEDAAADPFDGGAEVSTAPSAAAQTAEPVVEEIDGNDLGEDGPRKDV